MNRQVRVTMIEKKLLPEKEIIYGVYKFHPEQRLVYREVGRYADTVKVYMDYDEVINQEFIIFETIVFLPDTYAADGGALNDVGWYSVCVGGTSVINENNK